MHPWYNLRKTPVLWTSAKWSCFDIAFHELKPTTLVPSEKAQVVRLAVAWLCKNYQNDDYKHLRASDKHWFFRLPVQFFRCNFGSRVSPPGPLEPYIARVVKWSRIDHEPSGWAFTPTMKAKYDVFTNLLEQGPESQLTIKL